jgi:hypothetical protein
MQRLRINQESLTATTAFFRLNLGLWGILASQRSQHRFGNNESHEFANPDHLKAGPILEGRSDNR